MSICAASSHMKNCLPCQLPYLGLFASSTYALVEIFYLSNVKISAVKVPKTVDWLYATPLLLMIHFLLGESLVVDL